MVLYTALQQWWSARILYKELNKLQRLKASKGTKSDAVDDETSIDMAYCLYVVMGGFVVDVSSLHDEFKYLTLTQTGVHILAERGHFLRISGKSIRNKSKADSVAKVLVCFQMIWLMVQCITRKVHGYPISLLEVHTFVHAVCALLMWVNVGTCFFCLTVPSHLVLKSIQKPQDVRDPTLIDAWGFPELLACALIAQPFSKDRQLRDQDSPISSEPRITERDLFQWNNGYIPPGVRVSPSRIFLDAPPGSRSIQTVESGQISNLNIIPNYLY